MAQAVNLGNSPATSLVAVLRRLRGRFLFSLTVCSSAQQANEHYKDQEEDRERDEGDHAALLFSPSLPSPRQTPPHPQKSRLLTAPVAPRVRRGHANRLSLSSLTDRCEYHESLP